MSRRTARQRRNRYQLWGIRWENTRHNPPAAVAAQYDLARTGVYRVPLRADRAQAWRELDQILVTFNERFVDPAGATPTGRLAEGERAFKARASPADAVAARYDTARKYLRRMPDTEVQEGHWRELAKALARFNERFAHVRQDA